MENFDGEEKKIDAKIVYIYEEGDSSVGIPSGWYVAGIEINGELWDLDRDRGNVYQLSREDSDRLEKLSEKF